MNNNIDWTGIFQAESGVFKSESKMRAVSKWQWVIYSGQPTNPLVNDTDNDGIKDGEEVNAGADGYVTCPVLADTDGDGVWDNREVTGVGSPYGKMSDPTLKDSDDDGFADDVDREPCGDLVLKVDFSSFKLLDTLWNGYGYSVTACNMFFTIQVNGQFYSTGNFWVGSKDTWVSTVSYDQAMTYYFDVWDSNTSVSVEVKCYADNIDAGGDSLIDVRKASGTYTWTYPMSSGPLPCTGDGHAAGFSCDGRDGTVKFSISTVVLPRSNTIVVNGTQDGEGYGLQQTSTGKYRYDADDQVYLAYLNCSNAYDVFKQGVNVIVLPRSVALSSGFNTTLQDLGSITSSSPFYGAQFYATDNSKSTSSGHIIGVMSKDVTGTQAKAFLDALLVNGAERVGNYVQVTDVRDLCLMHLPRDVLEAIPSTGVVNGAFGAHPHDGASALIGGIISVVNTITLPVTFLWNGLVALGNFMAQLGTAVIEIGLKVICTYVSALWSVASAVDAVMDAAVDALNAFVTWAIDFICDAFNALIAQPLQALYDSLKSWATGLISLVNIAATDIQGGGSNSTASLPIFQYIIDSDIFKTLMLIGVSLFAVITLASFLGPFGFIGVLVAPFLVNILIAGMTAAAFALVNAVDVVGWIAGTIWDILGTNLVGGMADVMGATMGTISWLSSLVTCPLLGEIADFAISSIGAILSYVGSLTSDWTSAITLDIIGLSFAAFGCYELFFGIKSPVSSLTKLNPSTITIMKAMAIFEAGISTLELTTAVASYGD